MRKALYTHQEGGWQIVDENAMDQFPLKEFRDSPYVQEIVEPLNRVYLMEAIGGGPIINWPVGHFATYLRCTPRRPYTNESIACLYFLHEFSHLWTWRQMGGFCRPPSYARVHEPWHDWQQRAIDSELFASFASECEIYFHLPGLREKTFNHPIWIDRYLGGQFCKYEDYLGIDLSKEACIARAREHRRHVLEGKRSHKDWVEYAVGGYYKTNMDWVERYARETVGFGPYKDLAPFRCVEDHIPRMGDIDTHIKWLADVTPTREDMERLGLTPKYQIPLGLQAKTFGEEAFVPYLKRFSNDIFFK